MPINLRSSAREPKARSTSPCAIGPITFGISPSGVERSASKNNPIGLAAASKPVRTAAPFPRLGKFSSNRVWILAPAKASLAIADVASVEPSLTMISSLSGEFISRYSIVERAVVPIRSASLKQGMTTEKGGNRLTITDRSRSQTCRLGRHIPDTCPTC